MLFLGIDVGSSGAKVSVTPTGRDAVFGRGRLRVRLPRGRAELDGEVVFKAVCGL